MADFFGFYPNKDEVNQTINKFVESFEALGGDVESLNDAEFVNHKQFLQEYEDILKDDRITIVLPQADGEGGKPLYWTGKSGLAEPVAAAMNINGIQWIIKAGKVTIPKCLYEVYNTNIIGKNDHQVFVPLMRNLTGLL